MAILRPRSRTAALVCAISKRMPPPSRATHKLARIGLRLPTLVCLPCWGGLWVSLSDGRTIAAPLVWFPRLLDATPEQRALVELSKGGLHWDALDEDILVAGLLAGRPDLSRRWTHLAK
jgi:hypothetical protein